MNRKELISPFKNIWHFILVSIAFGLIFNLIFWNPSFKNPSIFILGLIWSLTIFISQWIGNVYVGYKIGEKYSWFTQAKTRVFMSILGIVLYSSVAFIIVQSIMTIIFFDSLPENASSWILNQLKITIPISLIFSFTFNSIGFFSNWKQSVLDAQKLETEMLRYKYASLQNQINPHFLFNSFNVLSDLITEDSALAVQFVEKMSALYRYVLESKDKELVPLQEEVDFLKKYIFLLETRFEKKVVFNLKIENTEAFLIVPMALQLLVENAVKHNIASSKKVLTISLKQKENTIEVCNNLQLKTSLEHSTKKGIENLKQQFKFFTENTIQIEKTTDKYCVEIPILKK